VDRAVIVGQVYDSVAGGGLAKAFVGVPGTSDSVMTDSEGRFELAVEASGDQTVTASHPKLGLVRGPTSKPVLLSLGDTTVVQFAVPPLTVFVHELCGARRRRSGVVGIAWGADGKPAANLEAVVNWRTPNGGARSERARISPKGLYALCDLPPDRTLPVWLEDRGYNLLEKPVRLEWAEYRWLDLRAWGSADTTVTPRVAKPPGQVMQREYGWYASRTRGTSGIPEYQADLARYRGTLGALPGQKYSRPSIRDSEQVSGLRDSDPARLQDRGGLQRGRSRWDGECAGGVRDPARARVLTREQAAGRSGAEWRGMARNGAAVKFVPVPSSTYFKPGFPPVGEQTCIPLPITKTDNNPNFNP
jgi:hypothetical protein